MAYIPEACKHDYIPLEKREDGNFILFCKKCKALEVLEIPEEIRGEEA